MITITECSDSTEYSGRSDAVIVAVEFYEVEEYLPYGVEGPRRMERRHRNVVQFAVGTTCKLYSHNGKIMSDVWDIVHYAVIVKEDGSYEEIRLGASEFINYKGTVDAPKVIIECYDLIQENERQLKLQQYEAKLQNQRKKIAELQAKIPAKGKTVKVVRGRKVPVGMVGTCFWVGDSAYGQRIGLKTDSGDTIWVALKNCEAI